MRDEDKHAALAAILAGKMNHAQAQGRGHWISLGGRYMSSAWEAGARIWKEWEPTADEVSAHRRRLGEAGEEKYRRAKAEATAVDAAFKAGSISVLDAIGCAGPVAIPSYPTTQQARHDLLTLRGWPHSVRPEYSGYSL